MFYFIFLISKMIHIIKPLTWPHFHVDIFNHHIIDRILIFIQQYLQYLVQWFAHTCFNLHNNIVILFIKFITQPWNPQIFFILALYDVQFTAYQLYIDPTIIIEEYAYYFDILNWLEVEEFGVFFTGHGFSHWVIEDTFLIL